MDTFALFANLENRPVLVVGGGAVAARKIETLLQAKAKVFVVSRSLNEELTQSVQQNQIDWLATDFLEAQLDNVFLVIAATNNRALNERVFQAAEQRQKLCNVVDNADLCSFIMPSIIDRSPLQVAISSNGTSPVLARLWRERLEALLPQHLKNIAKQAGQWRKHIKQILPEKQRRIFWEKVLTNQHYNLLHEQNKIDEAEAILHDILAQKLPEKGSVVLVGAGSGDAGLLTLKGLQHIQAADVVLYDALVSPDVLALIRRDADKICVGKRARSHQVAQEETNDLLVKLAKQGKRVVRLKGGDPFVFGRGGEELQVLKAHDIPYTVVPGVTAALGATAYAGIPLTHRDYAQTTMFITGHCQPNGHDLHWETLAQGNQTLVVYMGTIQAAELTEKLLQHGRAVNTPVAVISHGTLPTQQVFSGSLQDLPTLAHQAPAPALIVIGETAALHEELKWFNP